MKWKAFIDFESGARRAVYLEIPTNNHLDAQQVFEGQYGVGSVVAVYPQHDSPESSGSSGIDVGENSLIGGVVISLILCIWAAPISFPFLFGGMGFFTAKKLSLPVWLTIVISLTGGVGGFVMGDKVHELAELGHYSETRSLINGIPLKPENNQ